MGRGRAYDALDEDEANDLRLLIRRWRNQKGLTNQHLADAVRWRITRVVDMLSVGRPLRRSNVIELLGAIRRVKSRTLQSGARSQAAGVDRAIDLELRRLRTRASLPPALIAAEHITAIAAHLGAIMYEERPGRGKKRSLQVARDLERGLRRASPEMAYKFYTLFADARRTKEVKRIVNGYRKQLEAMGIKLDEDKA